MRRASKIDSNQAEIVNALWAAGATVQSLAAIGEGVPDLLVGFRGRLSLMEIKNPKNVPSKRRLTGDQLNWHFVWAGTPLFVVQTPDDALSALGLMRKAISA